MGDYAYLNGELLPESGAGVPLKDHGFLYGDGVFETILAAGGRIIRLDRHLSRLRDGLQTLQFAPVAEALLRQAVESVVNANGYDAAAVRLTVSRGRGAGRMRLDAAAEPTIAVTCDRLNVPDIKCLAAGVAAITVCDTRGAGAAVKSLNMLPNVMARRQAEQAGAYEAIFTAGRGLLLEGAATNVFGVKGELLLTPALDGRILPGITREKVLEIAARTKRDTSEMPVDVGGADEIFITNSIVGVVPVVAVDGQPVGRGKPGHVTASLRALYDGPF